MNLMIVSGHELINGSGEFFLEEKIQLAQSGIDLFFADWLSPPLFSELVNNHCLDWLRNSIFEQIELTRTQEIVEESLFLFIDLIEP